MTRVYWLAACLWACLSPAHGATVYFPENPGLGARANLDVVHTKRVSAQGTQLGPLHFQLAIGGIELTRGADGFNTVKAQGLDPLGQLGNPELPGTGVLLAIPPGVIPRITVTSRKDQVIEAVPVQPCQPKSRCRLPKGTAAFHFNAKVYESSEAFPPQTVRLEPVGSMHGLQLVRLAFYPLQMQMKQGSLRVATQLSVEVHFDGTPTPLTLPTALHRVVLQSVANSAEIRSLLAPSRAPETRVILTADALEPALQPFIQWKRQRGLRVDVFTYSTVGGTADGARKFLQTYYDKMSPKPSYLLLVGNKDTLPGFIEKTYKGPGISDYRYSLLDGDDPIPDILYGRLLADNEAETTTQVTRWIQYEKANSGFGWLSNAMTIASEEGDKPTDEEFARMVGQTFTTHGFFHVDAFYERDHTATRKNIWDALKQGRSWVTYFGHGAGTVWVSTNDFIDVSDVDTVDNPGKLPVIIDVACFNADWIDRSMPRCFGKSWMTQDRAGVPAGALGYYGGSVAISWYEPAVMSVGIAKYHFERPVHSLGAMVFAGQMYTMEKMGIGENTVDNIRWYNLFADPSLILRTTAPKEYTVWYERKRLGSTRQIRIQTRDAFHSGVAAVQASLSSSSAQTPLAVAETDTAGNLELTLPVGVAAKDILLTTSGYNLSTYQIPIPAE